MIDLEKGTLIIGIPTTWTTWTTIAIVVDADPDVIVSIDLAPDGRIRCMRTNRKWFDEIDRRRDLISLPPEGKRR